MLKSVRNADVNLLQVFVAVAESRGLSAAQYRLGVSPSTIRAQISHLETRIGIKLCNRGRAGFSLTKEGEAVLEATYDLLQEHDRFAERVYAMNTDLLGRVRISVIDGLLYNRQLRLAESIAMLRRTYPRLQFEVQQSPFKEPEQKVLSGEADLAITWIPATRPSLSSQMLFEEKQIICCGKGHPLFGHAPGDLDAADLESCDWVSDGYSVPNTLPFSRPLISTARTNSVEGICYFVLAGTHIAFMPEPYVQNLIDRGLIRALLPDRYGFSLPISLIWHQTAARDKKNAAARDALVQSHQN